MSARQELLIGALRAAIVFFALLGLAGLLLTPGVARIEWTHAPFVIAAVVLVLFGPVDDDPAANWVEPTFFGTFAIGLALLIWRIWSDVVFPDPLLLVGISSLLSLMQVRVLRSAIRTARERTAVDASGAKRNRLLGALASVALLVGVFWASFGVLAERIQALVSDPMHGDGAMITLNIVFGLVVFAALALVALGAWVIDLLIARSERREMIRNPING